MADVETILAFKAGRALRREGTNLVEPSPTKGAIMLTEAAEDGLTHFIWKNRATGNIEEDLILFQGDASFVKVQQAEGGRVYVLKFSSSDQRHFFWMQDASSARDDEFARNLHERLQDSEYEVTWPSQQASTSTVAQPAASGSSSVQPSSQAQATPEQLAQLQALVSQMTNQGVDSRSEVPDLALTDVLSPANIAPLLTAHPELLPSLFPHLPPDLPVPPSAEVIQQIVSSPQFRASVASFDRALRTGLLGGLVRGLGLPEEAGTSVHAFLRAIREQAEREGGGGSGRMDTS